MPAVDLSGLTNCENRVNTDDQVFFAVVNTAIKNKSGALMYLAVALDDMPSLVKINGNQGLGAMRFHPCMQHMAALKRL